MFKTIKKHINSFILIHRFPFLRMRNVFTDENCHFIKWISTLLNKMDRLSYETVSVGFNFIKLSEELVKVEDEIAFSRKYYNACIRDFNNLVETFPISIIASLFNFKSKDMFGISDDERNNTKVEM